LEGGDWNGTKKEGVRRRGNWRIQTKSRVLGPPLALRKNGDCATMGCWGWRAILNAQRQWNSGQGKNAAKITTEERPKYSKTKKRISRHGETKKETPKLGWRPGLSPSEPP